jgi:peptide deformylase
MQKPNIVRAGHPVLRGVAAEVRPEELGSKELSNLVKRMVEAMRAAPGVGLAAPQLGVDKRVIVVEDTEKHMSKLSTNERSARGRVLLPLMVIVNPLLEVIGAGTATFFEGCLSVPGYMALVERMLEVRVTGTDDKGEPVDVVATGWPARIFQHEVDHLDGMLYIDRMLSRTFGANEEVQQRWLSMSPTEVRTKLDA